MNDDCRFVTREEIQLRFGITARRLSGLLADPAAGVPVVHLTTIPQFELGAFRAWLIKNFGRGDWGMKPDPVAAPGADAPRVARAVARGRRDPLPEGFQLGEGAR